MVKTHKKQHFIPACYLRAWCDPETPPAKEPYIWVFSKEGQEVKPKAPKNVFHENDFYTIERIDGTRDLVLEHGLCGLEGLFTRVRREKLHPALGLSVEDKLILCAFTAAMHARTRVQREHMRTQWGAILDFARNLEAGIRKASAEQQPLFYPSWGKREQGQSLTIEQVERIVKNPTQSFLGSINYV